MERKQFQKQVDRECQITVEQKIYEKEMGDIMKADSCFCERVLFSGGIHGSI